MPGPVDLAAGKRSNFTMDLSSVKIGNPKDALMQLVF